jgi:hypothetical protein
MIALMLLGLAQAETLEEISEAEVSLEQRDARFDHHGELRVVGTLPPDFVVDSEGNTVGQGLVLDTRARLGGELDLGGSTLLVEGDVLDAQALGDTWDLGSIDERRRDEKGYLDADAYRLRQLSVSGVVKVVKVDVGLMTSHWGLGMVANDGDHDPAFGRNDLEDRVLRLKASTMLPDRNVAFVLAADRVVADDLARWADGQAAYQGIAAMLAGNPAGTHAGLYGVYRRQRELDRRRLTEAVVLDATGAWVTDVAGLDLRLAGEVALVTGSTSRALSYQERTALDVRSMGATGIAELSGFADDRGRFALRAGYASGDGDGADGQSSEFAFDRNFDVGMVLFDELGGALEASTYGLVSDPHHTGYTPDGVEATVTEGSFKRATFLQPVLTARVHEQAEVKLGYVMAWSTAPIAEAFESHRAGGVPTNHLGDATDGYRLGTELDWALLLGSGHLESGRALPQLLVQGGHAFLTPDLGGGSLHLVSAQARYRW